MLSVAHSMTWICTGGSSSSNSESPGPEACSSTANCRNLRQEVQGRNVWKFRAVVLGEAVPLDTGKVAAVSGLDTGFSSRESSSLVAHV